MRGRIPHLVRRALTSLDNSPLGEESTVAVDVLTDAELAVWRAMQPRDQRHSILVLARFDALCPGATRPERAAALLHDVGKAATGLGWWGRVVATVVGARTKSFAAYLDHERIGAEMIGKVSDAVTVDLVRGTAVGPVADALRQADET